MNWYSLRVKRGKEKDIRYRILEKVVQQNLSEISEEILIPSENIITIEEGENIEKGKVFFPGYLLIKMVLTHESRYLVESISGVIGFLGRKGKPMPLNNDNMINILEELSNPVNEDDEIKPVENIKEIFDKRSPKNIIVNRLKQLNEVMKNVMPEKVETVINDTIRKDSSLIKAIKEFLNYRCQFPDCEAKIPIEDGGYYIEVAHIKPVKEGGKSVIGNLLVLCPNHHKMIDYGDFDIIEQTDEILKFYLNGKYYKISHSL